jgi:hypothetical protein
VPDTARATGIEFPQLCRSLVEYALAPVSKEGAAARASTCCGVRLDHRPHLRDRGSPRAVRLARF